jgi:protease IV
MAALAHRTPPTVLELDLTQPLLEVEPADLILKLRSRGRPRLAKVLKVLDDAADDERVVGLVAKLGVPSMSIAIAQELGAAVERFRAAGKPTVAWAESFGDDTNGTVPYLLATGFGEIWLQPTGAVGLLGVATEVTFLRGVLDKIGVEPQLDKRYEFKNAADRLMNTEFTPEHEQAVYRLAESAWDVVLDGIARSRSISVDTLRGLAEQAPVPAAAALEAGLVDRLGYRDEVYAEVRRRAGGEVRLLFADKWAAKPPLARRAAALLTDRNKPVVALVEANGTIVSGRTRRSPMDGQLVGSDTVSAAIRAARNDDNVRAVVLRVDSPGGSAIASDTIWHEVVLAREAGKTVVVSMGTVAASGGYYIACPADVIVAQPATITGSIGVFGGKMVASGLMDKLGVATGAVAHGSRSRMYSPRVGFTEDQRAKLTEVLDTIYNDFIGKVGEGRRMSPAEVHEVARGRVWSGADAAGNGLVDQLGGLREAAAVARQRAGLPADAALRPAVQVPPLARLRAPRSSDDPRASIRSGSALAASMTGALALDAAAGWGGLTGLAAMLGLPRGGALMMPPIQLR